MIPATRIPTHAKSLGRKIIIGGCGSTHSIPPPPSPLLPFRRAMGSNTLYKFSVSSSVLDTIRATLPAVGAAGPAFTKHFYGKMFTNEPYLKGVFNQTNQVIGKQPEKLFKTIALAASVAVDTGELPGEAIETICQKHCALHIKEKEYDIVGANLLATIEDLLTKDKSVIDAWAALYGDIAGVFMTREKEIYDEMANTPGGWVGKRPFKLIFKEDLSEIVSRFTLVPVDGQPVPYWTAGKYTTVWADVPGTVGTYGEYDMQPRHYTLNYPHSQIEGQRSFAISVKKEGLVSNLLHEADMGTVFDLSAPYGCFDLRNIEQLWLTDNDAPVIFISAGIGITPVLAMLENCHITRPATWLYANANGGLHAYRDRIREIAAVRDGTLQRRVWYSDPYPSDGSPAGNGDNTARFHYKGWMDLEDKAKEFPPEVLHLGDERAQYYLCGPTGFMEVQKEVLKRLGVMETQIHYEGF